MKEKRFLFEYPFHGSHWAFEIIAVDETEARERIKSLPWAQYKGEIFAKIPATPRSLWARILGTKG